MAASHTRPHRFGQRGIVRVAKDFGHEQDELAFTVVFGHGVGAARVDAARHLAIVELARRVPAKVFDGDIGVAKPEQGFTHHRAIANPRACVRPRSRPQHGAVARDQDMRERCAHRVCKRLSCRWDRQRHPIQAFPPLLRHSALLAGEPRSGKRRCQRHWTIALLHGDDDIDHGATVWLQRECVAHRRSGVTLVIVAARPGGPCTLTDDLRKRTRVQREHADAIRTAQRKHLARCVDVERRAVPGDVVNSGDTANRLQGLRRRIDLKRAHGEHQFGPQRMVGPVHQFVARGDAVACASGDDMNDDHAQRPVGVLPRDPRHRKISVEQIGLRRDVGPGRYLAVIDDEGFDRKRTLAHLKRAIFRQQARIASAVIARPVSSNSADR